MKKLFVAAVLLTALSGIAVAKELHNLNRDGVAIQGYDPVAFFTDNRPVKGSSQFQYVVVQNATSPQANFSYWDSAEQAMRFRDSLSPTVVRMEFRLAELENPARQHGVRLGQVATRQNSIDELKRASIAMRAESYRRRLFSEFDRVKEMFLP